MQPTALRDRAVLVVESDPATQRALVTSLRALGYEPTVSGSLDQAFEALLREPFAFCLLDATVGESDGLDLLRRLRAKGRWPSPVILLTDEQNVARVAEATGLGADDFLPKQFRQTDLENALKEVENRPRSTIGSAAVEGDNPATQIRREIALWRSAKMREVWDIIQHAARVDVTVLIGGEPGTGKDLVARAIHHFSVRRHAPFAKANCAGVPGELLESELFGDERGAFTGAHQLRLGKLEMANRGTIFLDEIADLHPALQTKLLHVLQDGTLSRVGGTATTEVDVRVLAASNRDLEREVEAMRFREDLFHRLNVIQIVVPPLRERMDEMPLLASYFAQRYARLFHRQGFALSAGALDRLGRHHFPGNVRELENLVMRMVVLDDPDLHRTPFIRRSRTSGAGERPAVLNTVHVASRTAQRQEVVPLKEVARAAARAAEREAIARVLEQTGWNRVRAAKLLRISYRALLYKIKDVGLSRAGEPTGCMEVSQ